MRRRARPFSIFVFLTKKEDDGKMG